MKLKTNLALSCSVLLSAWTSQASIIADWTFEGFPDPPPIPTVTSGPISADVGSGSALGSHAGSAVYTSPVGNGSVNSFSATAWSVGDFWQFQVSTVGYQDIKLSWDQASSATGPRDFRLDCSTDGSSFTPVGAYTVLLNSLNWSSATPLPAYGFSYDLSSLTALNNDSSVLFRLVDESTVSANGGTVLSAGTDRVDNFIVSGTAVPEPSTWLAGALLALPFGLQGIRSLRNRKQAVKVKGSPIRAGVNR